MAEICTEYDDIFKYPCYPEIKCSANLIIDCCDDYFIINRIKYDYDFGPIKPGTYDLTTPADCAWDCGKYGIFMQYSEFNILMTSEFIKIFPPEICFYIPGITIRWSPNRLYSIDGYNIACHAYAITDQYIYYQINQKIFKIMRPIYSDFIMVPVPIDDV